MFEETPMPIFCWAACAACLQWEGPSTSVKTGRIPCPNVESLRGRGRRVFEGMPDLNSSKASHATCRVCRALPTPNLCGGERSHIRRNSNAAPLPGRGHRVFLMPNLCQAECLACSKGRQGRTSAGLCGRCRMFSMLNLCGVERIACSRCRTSENLSVSHVPRPNLCQPSAPHTRRIPKLNLCGAERVAYSQRQTSAGQSVSHVQKDANTGPLLGRAHRMFPMPSRSQAEYLACSKGRQGRTSARLCGTTSRLPDAEPLRGQVCVACS